MSLILNYLQKILLIAALKSFWIIVAKSTVCVKLCVVNNEIFQVSLIKIVCIYVATN